MLIHRADIDIITYLDFNEFKEIKNRIEEIENKYPTKLQIQEQLSNLSQIKEPVLSLSDVKGVGRFTVDGKSIFSKNTFQFTEIRFLFSTSCPIELEISFEIELKDDVLSAVNKVKDCCKFVVQEIFNLTGITKYRLCFASLSTKGKLNHEVINKHLSEMNLSKKAITSFENIIFFKRQYSDLDFDFFYAIKKDGDIEQTDIIKKIQKYPIIEKIGQMLLDNLESINYEVASLENEVNCLQTFIEKSNLNNLTKIRMKHLSLKESLLDCYEIYYSYREYSDEFLEQNENQKSEMSNGLLSNETNNIRKYYTKKIDHLRLKTSEKLMNIENAIDSGIELVNIKETMRLAKASFRLEKWMGVISVILFIFAIFEIVQALGIF